MVDLDPSLIKISEQHLPYWNGVKEDPRCVAFVGLGGASNISAVHLL